MVERGAYKRKTKSAPKLTVEVPDWSVLIAYICGQGYAKLQIALLLKCEPKRIYNIQAGIAQPNYKQGLLLIELYKVAKGEVKC